MMYNAYIIYHTLRARTTLIFHPDIIQVRTLILPYYCASVVKKQDVGWGPLDRYGNDGSPVYDTNIYLNVLYKIITTFV